MKQGYLKYIVFCFIMSCQVVLSIPGAAASVDTSSHDQDTIRSYCEALENSVRNQSDFNVDDELQGYASFYNYHVMKDILPPVCDVENAIKHNTCKVMWQESWYDMYYQFESSGENSGNKVLPIYLLWGRLAKIVNVERPVDFGTLSTTEKVIEVCEKVIASYRK